MILHEMDISHRKKSFTELMSQVNRRCNTCCAYVANGDFACDIDLEG